MSAAAPVAAQSSQTGRTIEQLTTTVSASRLSTWQRCRLQFYFRYIAGLEKAPTPARHIGTTVHTVLEQWNLGRWHQRQISAEELKEVFARAWSVWQESEEINWNGEEEACRASAWNILEHYFQHTPIPPDEKPEAVEVGVEADLSRHGLPTLVGVIDLVRSGGRIVDYKTTGRTPDRAMLAHTAEVQTTAYGLLYRESTGTKETAIELHHLVKTKVPKLVVTEFAPVTDTQVARLLHVIDAYVQGLQRKDFVPSPGIQCGSCEFFTECRAWR